MSRAKGGFTLIELLVTTALSLVLIGGSIAAYSSFLSQRTRTEAAKNVIAKIEEARNRARAGDTPQGCTGLDGYRVWANENSQTYSIALRCSGESSDREVVESLLGEQEYFLASFSVLFPTRPGPVPGAPATVRIGRLDEEAYEYEFEILGNGVVEDRGLQIE